MKGGYRKGAGRKKGFAAKSAEEARKVLSERVAAEIGPIAEILICKAKKGDIRAIKELLDRAWGKAPQSLALEASESLQVSITSFSHLSNEELEKIASARSKSI